MIAETRTIKAGCLCGLANHEVSLPSSAFPLPASTCHCDSCRHTTGTLSLAVVSLPGSYSPDQSLVDKLVAYRFSYRMNYYHCPKCAAQLMACTFKDPNDPSKGGRWDLTCGSLEHADGVFEIKCHQFIEDTLDGGFADFLPAVNGRPIERWAGTEGKSEHLPLHWRSPSRPSTNAATASCSERLYAHCRCKGVQLWISRPEPASPEGLESKWYLRSSGRKYKAVLCACNSCRLSTGREWVDWAFIPPSAISLDAKGTVPFNKITSTLDSWRSSENVLRYFCSCCGAVVFYVDETRLEALDVAAGLFAAPEGARAEGWLEWEKGRVDFREDAVPRARKLVEGLEEGLERYGQRLDEGER